MILCDTNIFIEIYKGNVNIIKAVEEIGQENIAISDVTCYELFYGARNKKELKTIRKDLNKLAICAIENKISTMAVSLLKNTAFLTN